MAKAGGNHPQRLRRAITPRPPKGQQRKRRWLGDNLDSESGVVNSRVVRDVKVDLIVLKLR